MMFVALELLSKRLVTKPKLGFEMRTLKMRPANAHRRWRPPFYRAARLACIARLRTRRIARIDNIASESRFTYFHYKY